MTDAPDTAPAKRTQRALVSGGTGFIGSHLVRALVSTGWQVHVLTRKNLQSQANIQFHSIPADGEPLLAQFERIRPDVVFHLATFFIAEHRPEHVKDIIDANLLFGTRLLEGMAACGTRRIVNVGTAWQHLQSDSADYHPANLYAASKQAFEALLDFYCEAYGLDAISLKLFDSYGSGDTRPKLLNMLMRTGNDVPPIDLSPGEQQLKLVHVHDVVGAILHSAGLVSDQEGPRHRRYVLGDVSSQRLKDIVGMMESLAGRKFNIRWGAKPYRTREIMTPWEKGLNLPGWHPQVTLQQGLSDLLGKESLNER